MKKQRKNKKILNENGAASVLVLFTIFTFIVILMGSFMSVSTLRKSQLKSDLRIKEIYKEQIDRIDEIYVEKEAEIIANEQNVNKAQLLTLNKRQLLTLKKQPILAVNKPQLLTGMTPIKFNMPTNTEMGEIVTTNEEDTDWYEYGTTYETRRWANAKTEDGSMWVWIPRFAYKITYYTDSTKTVKSNEVTSYGKIDVKFLIGDTDRYYEEDGSLQTAQRQTTTDQTIDVTADYTVHPAFTNESSIGYVNGGWDSELTGIWVAKFKAGYASGNNMTEVKASNVNYSQTNSWVKEIESTTGKTTTLKARNWLDGIYGTTETAIKYPTFQGTTYVMNYINHNDAYNIARALTDNGNIYGLNSTNSDSHLMKNSEWGAVAYLSKSQYGQYETEMTTNNINLNSGGRQRTETAGKTGVDSVYAVTGCSSNTTNTSNNIVEIENLNASIGDTGVSGTNGTAFKWNQKTGQNASTTGTIYGIYDMSGSLWERTADFISNGHENLVLYGKSLLDETKVTYEGRKVTANTGENTKYVTIYPYKLPEANAIDTSSKNSFANNTKIYGDAVRETTTSNAGTSNTGWNVSSWNNDYSYFPSNYYPFFRRGGNLWDGDAAGSFAFNRTNGFPDYDYGFRAVLVNYTEP